MVKKLEMAIAFGRNMEVCDRILGERWECDRILRKTEVRSLLAIRFPVQ
ncbi:hypothetical protein H6S82_09350 [Planktothrix sp. FACHB-1355]|uniref:Uncharacterized protein n=1 Tax=Aerosakkonema funiforme FACHB-1375 TaxID=2949571 RepID=A0A926VJG0_9CYAN|nr:MULTISPECIES: hypothetical protein [Oscillatoriales]MBD2184768.1 hypothetical protein [Aerosakkonema funiforme FACHB-1375]MBD3559063.1 hypothetical protein [Planktothrix sp. FACHB-1355]